LLRLLQAYWRILPITGQKASGIEPNAIGLVSNNSQNFWTLSQKYPNLPSGQESSFCH